MGDLLDVVLPVVSGVGEATRATKSTVRIISDVDDVIDTAKAVKHISDTASELRKSNGFYVVLYEKGQYYIGKGGFGRAISSANNHMSSSNKATAIIWVPARSERTAFVSEYLLQSIGGLNKNNKKSLNLIWSPGKSIVKSLK